MSTINTYLVREKELYHHGIKGMKWGKRRFQNTDGSLTAAGRQRYLGDSVDEKKSAYKDAKKAYSKSFDVARRKNYQSFSLSKTKRQASDERWKDAYDKAQELNKAKAEYKQAKNDRKYGNKIKSQYTRAGRNRGWADYTEEQGRKAYESHERLAKAAEKKAKQLDKSGNYFAAEAARRGAEALRARGKNIQDSRMEEAKFYVRRSEHLNAKASAYATEKRVNLGKSTVDAILKESRAKGYERAKYVDEANREYEIEERYGEEGVDIYRRVRGK